MRFRVVEHVRVLTHPLAQTVRESTQLNFGSLLL